MHDETRQPDKTRPEPDWDALARVFASESDSDEASAMAAWIAAHPADASYVANVKAHDRAHADGAAAVDVDVEAALRRVQARMAEAPPRLEVVRGGAPRFTPVSLREQTTRWGRITFAAAIAAGIVAGAGVRKWPGGTATSGTARVLATRVGERDSLTLSDGSTVVLAPASRLTVAAGFDGGDRVVTLEGAAFFNVRHDAAHPFTVRSAGAEIRDIGTAFTVKTDAVGAVSVSVTHGIVAVRETAATTASAAPVELHAGDRGVVREGAVVVTRGTVAADDDAWTRGQLSYRDASLAEVQADLKRWYGINLQVADSALMRLTVTMPAQPDSARVLSTIAALLGADVEQRGDTFILRTPGRSTIP